MGGKELIDKLFMPDVFEVNGFYFQKTTQNTLLGTTVEDIALAILGNEKPEEGLIRRLYRTLDQAIEYLNMYEKRKQEGFTFEVLELSKAYRFISFIIKDCDADIDENIPKARDAVSTLKNLIQAPPEVYEERLSFYRLLDDYSKVLMQPRKHEPCKGDIADMAEYLCED